MILASGVKARSGVAASAASTSIEKSICIRPEAPADAVEVRDHGGRLRVEGGAGDVAVPDGLGREVGDAGPGIRRRASATRPGSRRRSRTAHASAPIKHSASERLRHAPSSLLEAQHGLGRRPAQHVGDPDTILAGRVVEGRGQGERGRRLRPRRHPRVLGPEGAVGPVHVPAEEPRDDGDPAAPSKAARLPRFAAGRAFEAQRRPLGTEGQDERVARGEGRAQATRLAEGLAGAGVRDVRRAGQR